jgi:hypothetical protein
MSIIDMRAAAKSNEPAPKWQICPVACYVGDTERLGCLRVAGVPDEGRRDIDGMHRRPEPHELTCVRSFAATDIEASEAADRRQHVQERRCV